MNPLPTLKNLSFLLPGLIFMFSCHCRNEENNSHTTGYLPQAPDYTIDSLWYTNRKGASYDVFYIVPTCVWNWNQGLYKDIRYADVYQPGHRNHFLDNMKLADSIFSSEANFYSPYYRQITLDNWIEGENSVNLTFPLAYSDVKSAFLHYLKEENHDRPFILAGFSQGAKMVVELLKDMDEPVYQRLIAAYAAGYRVTREEAEEFPHRLKAARDSADQGVLICYNSASGYDRIPEVLNSSVFCINPVNWSTHSDTVHLLPLHSSAKVCLDTALHYLQIVGLDENFCYVPQLSGIFPPGNFHLMELLFYRQYLSENVKLRARLFHSHTPTRQKGENP